MNPDPSRPYSSAARDAKAADTRDRIVAATAALLRAPAGGAPSLDAVAKAAGVTRLTVYNQFGSRRGLFEATFDSLAASGGLTGFAEAMALGDPRAGLARLVGIFCGFWSSHEGITAIFSAAALDPDLGETLAARNERRRDLLSVIVDRHGATGARQDVVDTLFMLTSFATFKTLRIGQRDADAVRTLLVRLCDRVLDGI
jgi:AcrR family transcriptional regulator